MARDEHDREDLLREATALVERVELRMQEFDEPIIVGFRREGSASFYFGSDPVLQFNSQGELRRGFWNGRLIKAMHGRLTLIERVRAEEEVVLKSRVLSDQEAADFMANGRQQLVTLQVALRNQTVTLVGQVPEDRDILGRILQWLNAHAERFAIANRPHVG